MCLTKDHCGLTQTTSIKCDHITLPFPHHPEMGVSDDQGSSQLTGALKLFKERLQEQTFTIQGIPGFIVMTHRGACSTCETYATHTIASASARCPTVAILSHQINLMFQTAWPQVVTLIKDEAVDKAHSKLS